MAHQYSRVGFKSSVEVNEVNLSLSYGGVGRHSEILSLAGPIFFHLFASATLATEHHILC